MRVAKYAIWGVVFAAFSMLNTPTAISADQLPATIGNLERVDNAKADIAYRDPNADFTRYHRILLDDLDMSKVNIVQPSSSYSRSSRRAWELTDKDRESLGKAFRDAMTKALTKAGYPVVTEPAEDVLRLSVALTDLAPAAPKDDMQSRPGRSMVFTEGAGKLAIGAIVLDSMSGEVLAMIKDSKQAGTTAQLNTSVSNLSDVRQAFAGWARQLCKRLDSIHNGAPSQP